MKLSPDEMSDSELLTRIDERVKQLCDTTDKLLEKQGSLENRVQSNESDIEKLDDDIRNLDADVSNLNRNVIIGSLMTIFTILVTAYFTGGIPV